MGWYLRAIQNFSWTKKKKKNFTYKGCYLPNPRVIMDNEKTNNCG